MVIDGVCVQNGSLYNILYLYTCMYILFIVLVTKAFGVMFCFGQWLFIKMSIKPFNVDHCSHTKKRKHNILFSELLTHTINTKLYFFIF